MTRLGETETRSHFERARDDFEVAGGETLVGERVDTSPGCPECGAPMTLRKSYREPSSYRFEGICSADEAHNILR